MGERLSPSKKKLETDSKGCSQKRSGLIKSGRISGTYISQMIIKLTLSQIQSLQSLFISYAKLPLLLLNRNSKKELLRR